MVAHMTLGIDTTCAWAGILTLLIYAGLIRATLGTDNTLGTTGGRSTYKLWQAAANCLTLRFSTL